MLYPHCHNNRKGQSTLFNQLTNSCFWLLLCLELLFSSVAINSVQALSTLRAGAAATRLMPPVSITEKDGEGKMKDVKHFQPKTYTVNDFHLLVQGFGDQINAELIRIEKDAENNNLQLTQRVQLLEEMRAPEKDFCSVCTWISRQSGSTGWLCWCAIIAGSVLLVLGLLTLVFIAPLLCCRRLRQSKSGHQMLLNTV